MQLIDLLAVGVTDSAGSPLANGTVTFYQAGTTTLETVYQDFEASTPHSNPATLDAAGRLVAFSDMRLKIVIASSTGAAVRTIDGVGVTDSQITDLVTTGLAGNGLNSQTGVIDVNVDDDTITIVDDVVKVKDGGIDTTQLADGAVETAKINDGAVTQAKRATLGQQVSSSSSTFTTASTTPVDVTNLSVSITTTGRPVVIALQPDGNASNSSSLALGGAGFQIYGTILLKRDSTTIAIWRVAVDVRTSATEDSELISVPASLTYIDAPAANTYTYKIQVNAELDTDTFYASYLKLVAYEL